MRRLIGPAVAVVAVLALPFVVSDFRASQLAYVAVYFVALLGLDLVAGQAGQLSLGHGAFMAIGGYTTANLVVEHGVRDVWTLPAAALAGGLAGAALGLGARRLSGLQLALATLALAVAVPPLAKRLGDLTGGATGLQLFGAEAYTGKGFEEVAVLGARLSFNHWLYVLCWTVAGALYAAYRVVAASGLGLRFRAVRDSELAATVSGVPVAATKVAAFGVGAAYAGVAGALFALASTFVSPETFGLNLSLLLVIGLAVGGRGSLWGLLAGAALIQFLPELAQEVSNRPGLPSVVYGAVVVAAALLLPAGVGGALARAACLVTHRHAE